MGKEEVAMDSMGVGARRKCGCCGMNFQPMRALQRFCSTRCRSRFLLAPEHKDLLIQVLTKRIQEVEKELAAGQTRRAYTRRSQERRARVRTNLYQKWTKRKKMTRETEKTLRRSIVAHLRIRRSWESERHPA
jgi:hypothetical protein